ncbi:MAG: single-stranded DNA-binding protein [Ruminococcaceae bacterium]|nr:single-stranded DNA-binding protein [Oscillospiraceae bacterium]
MEQNVNQITIRGQLTALPEFSHENHGKRFYRFQLDVPRLSGNIDCLPVVAEEQILEEMDLSGGCMLTVTGQVRSHNSRVGGSRHLLIFVFAASVIAEDGPPCNDLVIEGPLCKEPIYRRTPLGREICDGMLAVTRNFRRADYLPCIFWGRTAEEISLCHTGDRIHIVGRLQSRTYIKRTEEGQTERVAYEISALSAQITQQEM